MYQILRCAKPAILTQQQFHCREDTLTKKSEEFKLYKAHFTE
jgi:hypothetical protein